MKKIPISIEDFKEIKTECYCVDKTMILLDIFSKGESSTMLYTRPRRFGKSLTLSMIEYFLSDRFDSKTLFGDTEFIRTYPQYLEYINTKSVVRINLKSIYKKDYQSFLTALSTLKSIGESARLNLPRNDMRYDKTYQNMPIIKNHWTKNEASLFRAQRARFGFRQITEPAKPSFPYGKETRRFHICSCHSIHGFCCRRFQRCSCRNIDELCCR